MQGSLGPTATHLGVCSGNGSQAIPAHQPRAALRPQGSPWGRSPNCSPEASKEMPWKRTPARHEASVLALPHLCLGGSPLLSAPGDAGFCSPRASRSPQRGAREMGITPLVLPGHSPVPPQQAPQAAALPPGSQRRGLQSCRLQVSAPLLLWPSL